MQAKQRADRNQHDSTNQSKNFSEFAAKKIRNLTPQIPCFRSIGSPEQALGEYLNQTGGELKKEGSIQLAASSGEEN